MSGKGGSLKSSSINGMAVYSLEGERNPASWLNPQKLRARQKDEDYRRRVELVQDLRFETATKRIKVTPDGDYVIASGTYPPQVKVFELKQHTLKFERHLVSEIVDFQVLGDDYAKIAFLCEDRSVHLHAKYGSHHSLRIPRMGRDTAYDCWSCDLLCAASSPDVYRINLEQGRFLSSLNTQSPAVNIVSRSNIHGLVACGGEDGSLECFDMRKRASVGRINATGNIDEEVTALEFDDVNGYLMAVGSSAGKISIYDLRKSESIRDKDHMYGNPIVSIKWLQTLNSAEPKLISADKHIVRIWDPNTGDNMTSIEPTGTIDINDICVFPKSGLMMLALDSSQILSYFIPSLGPAPNWCSHLANLTEEMEEGSESTNYDHFKFLTKEDLERLNLTNLIGTNLLRAVMHGFFVDHELYKKALALATPNAFDDYKENLKQQKIEEERSSRITMKKKLPKVNRILAGRILENQEEEDEAKTAEDANIKKKSKKNKVLGSEFLKDERFKDLFANKDFEVDEFSPEYISLHPQTAKKHSSFVEEHFEPVMEDYDDDDDDVHEQGSSELDASEGSDMDESKLRNRKRPRLYEVKDERHADAFWKNRSLAKEDALPLEERVALQEREVTRSNKVKIGPGGSREISFFRRSGKHQAEEPRDGNRRGVQSLGLKPAKSEFYSSGGRGGRGRGRGRGGGRGSGGGRGRSRGRGRH